MPFILHHSKVNNREMDLNNLLKQLGQDGSPMDEPEEEKKRTYRKKQRIGYTF